MDGNWTLGLKKFLTIELQDNKEGMNTVPKKSQDDPARLALTFF